MLLFVTNGLWSMRTLQTTTKPTIFKLRANRRPWILCARDCVCGCGTAKPLGWWIRTRTTTRNKSMETFYLMYRSSRCLNTFYPVIRLKEQQTEMGYAFVSQYLLHFDSLITDGTSIVQHCATSIPINYWAIWLSQWIFSVSRLFCSGQISGFIDAWNVSLSL